MQIFHMHQEYVEVKLHLQDHVVCYIFHPMNEQQHEELVADPLVASAMDLFADAEIIGVK